MRIAIDIFGGDNAPLEPLKACVMAKEAGLAEVIAVGDESKIKEVAAAEGISLEGITVVHAPDVIPIEADATEITKKYANSSMAVALKLVAQGEADAVISAGSTAAFVVGATFIVKRIRGVKRAAFAPVIPSRKGKYMMVDVGANVDCRPEMLNQFALLGSIYMDKVLGVENPRVGLINIGAEESKGQELQVATYQLLKEAPINFIGNIEPRYLSEDVCDVAVADGFTGNIVLKTLEGTVSSLFGELKGVFYATPITKMAALILKKNLKKLKNKMDYSEYGGSALLGICKPVIKVHGDSVAKTFVKAMGQAVKMDEMNVCGLMADAVKAAKGEE